jgi:ER-bound oxygenase mpaB/B'/Rubber oxygenase, catalytic domain
VSNRSEKKGAGIISQKDMVITQFAFVGIQLLNPEKSGIQASREQLENFAHYWRVIGALLGIEDRFNICGATLDETLSRLTTVRHLLLPNFTNMNPNVEKYLRIAVEGMKGFEPWLNPDVQLFTVKRLLGVPGFHFFAHEKVEGSKDEFKSLSRFTRTRITIDVIIFEYLSLTWGCRWLFNIPRIIFSAVFDRFPLFAIAKFGWKFAFVKIMQSERYKAQ